MIEIKQGLNLPIAGSVLNNEISQFYAKKVAILGIDFPNLKPSIQVETGQTVHKGQILFTDKYDDKINFTAPFSGTIAEINRGDKRILESIIIDVNCKIEAVKFDTPQNLPQDLSADNVKNLLLESGAWTHLRTRPFDEVPKSNQQVKDLFITAIDSNPLAVNPRTVINLHTDAFELGLQALSCLVERIFVCQDSGDNITTTTDKIQIAKFSGVHPAGNVGTHIHFLSPVSASKSVWHISYQAVIAIGYLFKNGELYSKKIISLAGPAVKTPALYEVDFGADLQELTADKLQDGHNRVISGSVFGGRRSQNKVAFLGHYHNQVTALEEGLNREFLSYLRAGYDKFSVANIWISKFLPPKLLNWTTSTQGSERAMVPIGTYEEVMPLDILPTQLLRSLIIGDLEQAEKLGALELTEEDLALCTFVCPGKYEYGPILRSVLNSIKKGM